MGDLMSIIEYWEEVKDWAEDLNIDLEKALSNPASSEASNRIDYSNIEDYFETPREFEKWFKAHLVKVKKLLSEFRGNVPLDPFYEKSFITLVDNLHSFPKVEDDTKTLELWLKKYDDMVHTLQIEFMNELNKMAAPHKGGTIETAHVAYRPRTNAGEFDLFMRGLKQTILELEEFNDNDPDLDVLKMMVEPVPINVFQRRREGKENDIISFTINSNEMRTIRKFLERVRVHRNIDQESKPDQLSKWQYDDTGNLERIVIDEKDDRVLDRMVKIYDQNRILTERAKYRQFSKIIDSDMPIRISLKKHYLLSPPRRNIYSGTSPELKASGEIVLNKYVNPKQAHSYFLDNINITKEGLKHNLERGNTIYLPHLNTRIQGTMPKHFPSDQVVEILSEALINYETKLHIKYVEGEFSNVFSKVDFTNINTTGVKSTEKVKRVGEGAVVPEFRDADRNLDADAPYRGAGL